MFVFKPYAAAMIFICLALPKLGVSATIDSRGSTAFLNKIGPWYISITTYENGERLCWAHNFFHQEKHPSFAFHNVVSKGSRNLMVRFDSIGQPKTNEEVIIKFSGFEFTMFHPPDRDHHGFFLRSPEEFNMFINELIRLSKKTKKTFTVTDSSGRTYKYRADRVAEAIKYITTKCGRN